MVVVDMVADMAAAEEVDADVAVTEAEAAMETEADAGDSLLEDVEDHLVGGEDHHAAAHVAALEAVEADLAAVQ